METFNEEVSNVLLSKEWLAKVDNTKSVPYLLKFCTTEESKVCILITDTKTVWSEVITSKQVLRRWRDCNPTIPIAQGKEPDLRVLNLLSLAHTIGAISDASFDVVDSSEADLAIELEFDAGFKWRWDTYLLGPKTSADVLSKHLIMPLISVAHVSFYSADPVSELEGEELEKIVDKIGRTARRSVDIHLRQTLARPRIATTIQRVSSLFGFAPTPTPIKSDVDSPDLEGPLAALRAELQSTSSLQPSPPNPALVPEPSDMDVPMREASPQTRSLAISQGSIRSQARAQESSAGNVQGLTAPTADQDESATESDDDPELLPPLKPATSGPTPATQTHMVRSPSPSSQRTGVLVKSNAPADSRSATAHAASVSESDSPPPTKKVKGKNAKVVRTSESDSDSDAPGSKNQSQTSNPRAPAGRGSGTGITRGVRQPIKRGAKRF